MQPVTAFSMRRFYFGVYQPRRIAMLRWSLVLALAAAGTVAASAQTIVVKPAERPALPQQVRVSIGVNMFVPAADDNSDQSLKAQEDARRKIYELASH